MNLLSSRQLAEKQGAVPCCPAGRADEPVECLQMSCFVKVQGIKTLVQQFYSNGPPTNLEFTVVLAAEDDGDDLMKKAGKIKRISPEEPVTLGFISY